MEDALSGRLAGLSEKYRGLMEQLSDPAVMTDRKKFAEISRAQASMAPLMGLVEERTAIAEALAEAEAMLPEAEDEEMRRFLMDEIERDSARLPSLDEEIKELLVADDPNDQRDVIMEIRAGAGGDEAALFAGDLYRMFTRYAESNGWKTCVLSSSPSSVGGYKEIIFEVKGAGAFSRLKYESGVHRVQRVPTTESGGRIHTSTATVAVLPAMEDVEVEVSPQEIRIDIYRSSGPGGQSVNTTDSAVRITHLPTGLTVQCQDEKSQLQNKEQAMKILRARLQRLAEEEAENERSQERRSQVGGGDRSEKIRTYNFPQGRVTDHRIKLTVHNLPAVLEGEIGELVEALTAAGRAEKLRASGL